MTTLHRTRSGRFRVPESQAPVPARLTEDYHEEALFSSSAPRLSDPRDSFLLSGSAAAQGGRTFDAVASFPEETITDSFLD